MPDSEKDRYVATVIVFLLLLAALGGGAAFLVEVDKCHQKRGVIVNTFLGYECVEPKK